MYKKRMAIVFDQRKSDTNEKRRGLPFEMVEAFGWNEAKIVEDIRFPYPERRFQALGMIGGILHMVVFTRVGDDIRVISLRRASRKERKNYGEET